MIARPENITKYTKLAVLGGGTFVTDISQQAHTITNTGPCSEGTGANKKFTASSALISGSTNYLSSADSADWKICAYNGISWTIDFWIKVTNWPGGGDGTIAYCADNWTITLTETTHRIKITQVGYTSFETGDDALPDTDWHHVVIVRKSSSSTESQSYIGPVDWGIYVDGAYVYNYAANTSVVNATGILYIRAGLGIFYINDFRITRKNHFFLTPTDPFGTYTVPTSDFAKLNMRNSNLITAH